jgi:hypothetical protein
MMATLVDGKEVDVEMAWWGLAQLGLGRVDDALALALLNVKSV